MAFGMSRSYMPAQQTGAWHVCKSKRDVKEISHHRVARCVCVKPAFPRRECGGEGGRGGTVALHVRQATVDHGELGGHADGVQHDETRVAHPLHHIRHPAQLLAGVEAVADDLAKRPRGDHRRGVERQLHVVAGEQYHLPELRRLAHSPHAWGTCVMSCIRAAIRRRGQSASSACVNRSPGWPGLVFL